MRRGSVSTILVALLASGPAEARPEAGSGSLFDQEIALHEGRLRSQAPRARARAAESLGFLRAYAAEPALLAALGDPVSAVRRQAALSLAWCGGRPAVEPLLEALEDPDWLVRQGAWVALTNITGMELPYDGTGDQRERRGQVSDWRSWWSGVAPGRPPREALHTLTAGKEIGRRWAARASSTYRGPASVLFDGEVGPAYWQTKNVPFPQWLEIDLGEEQDVGQIVVHQYGPRFVMTGWKVDTRTGSGEWVPFAAGEGPSAVTLDLRAPPRPARLVRITSRSSINPTYPTTFFEIDVRTRPLDGDADREARAWRLERAARALGALGGEGAAAAIIDWLGPRPPSGRALRPATRAAIRALGRLGGEEAFGALAALLDSTQWARHAAMALGDVGDPRAVGPLLTAYERYAKEIDGRDPSFVPPDDKMGFPSEDRMLETPWAIAYALCRLPLGEASTRARLRALAPRLLANLPGDHDAMMLYEPEPAHRLTSWLLEAAGLRQEAAEQAFLRLGLPRREPAPQGTMAWPEFAAYRVSSWLPAIASDARDVPRLVDLLEHPEGWVRINAAKSLAWIGDRKAIPAIAGLLAAEPAEAEHGYSARFKDEEYDDPSPRWREGLLRALGILGAREHTALAARILEDDGSVLEVRRAAARALRDIGGAEAVRALRRAATSHPMLTVRQTAADALRELGAALPGAPRGARPRPSGPGAPRRGHPRVPPPGDPGELPRRLVFVKGSNDLPNTHGTVEQADRWRQTYVVTDSGPVYRPGRDLWLLHLDPGGAPRAEPLTRFGAGWVGEPEVTWDGATVLFTRRSARSPWWHVWSVRVDGGEPVQITSGPFHDVGPVELPDGRIAFASSRSGLRDEYHGYPCTALYTMRADGSDMRPIAMNIGRDNEPAVLPDGRLVFSRLEVFYSRNKTELTLHAARPDGSLDSVLYGPERRTFWRQLDHGPRTPADGQEAPLTHRVLRMTQPQAMPDGEHIVVATQGGLTLVGPCRDRERIISPDNRTRSYTTPFPLADGRILCASTLKTPDRSRVNLGLFVLDPSTGDLRPLYDDPTMADFEPRPVAPRRPPPVLSRVAKESTRSGRFLCASVFVTQEPGVRRSGRLVRLIEGIPEVARHSTHTNDWEVWKNHGGTLARVLGTAPLAPDGSFLVEAPADRLLHFQVLDSDRRVVGNQLTWIYPRPGETRSCVGCHEEPHSVPPPGYPDAAAFPPVDMRPRGDEFRYRAKAWFKGHLPDEIEERTRTARAVNLLAR